MVSQQGIGHKYPMIRGVSKFNLAGCQNCQAVKWHPWLILLSYFWSHCMYCFVVYTSVHMHWTQFKLLLYLLLWYFTCLTPYYTSNGPNQCRFVNKINPGCHLAAWQIWQPGKLSLEIPKIVYLPRLFATVSAATWTAKCNLLFLQNKAPNGIENRRN